jgi:AcrR family transcriptional regulator
VPPRPAKVDQPPKADQPRLPPRPPPEEAGLDPRERIIRIAYELFTREGLTAVGVDRIIEEARVAKATLYRHFRSKEDLIAEILERHQQLWVRDWLEPVTRGRGEPPADRLLSVFDTLDEWFRDENFQGCLPTNSLVEIHGHSTAIRSASLGAIEEVYSFLERLAIETAAPEPERLAERIHLLLRGVIVAATEGNATAVQEARAVAQNLIENALPRREH